MGLLDPIGEALRNIVDSAVRAAGLLPAPLRPLLEAFPHATQTVAVGLSDNIWYREFTTPTGALIRSFADDLNRVAQTAAISVVEAAGQQVTGVVSASNGTIAIYASGWKEVSDQSRKAFKEVVDAAGAIDRFARRQASGTLATLSSTARRLREGHVVDAIWGWATEPLTGLERNFALATQESSLINTAASSAAAAYGGPAGAAAYASWSTYRATGDADLALRAGVIAGLTHQFGQQAQSMPSGTFEQLVRKSIVAGATGGLAVAAAGGDESAVLEAFLKSGGTVLVQGGETYLQDKAPNAYEAYKTIQCISARDLECLSNRPYVRDARGRIERRISAAASRITDSYQWSKNEETSPGARYFNVVAYLHKLPGNDKLLLNRGEAVLSWDFNAAYGRRAGAPRVVLSFTDGSAKPFRFRRTVRQART